MTDDTTADWNTAFERMSDAYVDAVEQNIDAQAEFFETWTTSVEERLDPERADEAVESYARAYEVWMDAAEEAVERTDDVVSGEAGPEEFRDMWLDAANESFKRVMGTEAFAAATGQALDDALDIQQQLDEATQATLHAYGFATSGDVDEIGERLVELERRQQRVEEKIDRVIEALE